MAKIWADSDVVVAERLAHRRSPASSRAQHLVLARRPFLCAGDHVAGDGLRRLHRNRRSRCPGGRASRRARRRRPASPRAPARRRSSSFSGGRTPRLRAMPLRSYALMKPGAFQRTLEHRLQRAIERRVAGAVLEVGDHHRDRLVLLRRLAARRVKQQVPREHRHHEHSRSRRSSAGVMRALIGISSPLLVERDRARRPARRSSGSGPRDRGSRQRVISAVERVGNARRRAIARAAGAAPFAAAARQSRCPPASSRRLAQPGEHVVENQPEARRCRPADRPPAPSPARAPCTRASRRWCRRSSLAVSTCDGRAGDASAESAIRRPHRRRARDAEVHDERVVLGGDHDVRRLQIAMDDARLVRGDQAGGDLPRDAAAPRRPAACPPASAPWRDRRPRRTAS